MGLPCHTAFGPVFNCGPDDAPTGLHPYTDQTYQGADQFDDVFPYLRTPIPGSPNPYRTFSANLGNGACVAVPNINEKQLAISCALGNNPVAATINQGLNGPVVCNLNPNNNNLFQAVCQVNPAFLEALQTGNTYVHIHGDTDERGQLR